MAVDDLKEPRVGFLIGSPRSGTTWLQNMLASRPEVASPPELGLFTSYIGPMWRQWVAQVDSYAAIGRRRRWGLPLLLSEDEFLASLEVMARSVYARALEAKPEARVILDKDPENSFHVELIARLFPDAAFIHLIRDGRDVTVSLLRASRDWAARWAPRTVYAAAKRWNDTARAACRAIETDCPYEEIRYEDLARNDPSGLVRAFKTIGVDVRPEEAETILRSHDKPSRDALVRRTTAAVRPEEHEPPRFSSSAAAWRTWTPYERYAFDHAAGDLLLELGYENDRVTSVAGWKPLAAARLTAERRWDAAATFARRVRRIRLR